MSYDSMVWFCLLSYLLYRAYVYCCRPEQLAQERQHAHERQMAKQAARKETAGKLASGIGGAATKIIFDVLFGRRRL
jgi:hypothetical protein